MGRPNRLDWGTAGELDDIEGQVAIVGVGEALSGLLTRGSRVRVQRSATVPVPRRHRASEGLRPARLVPRRGNRDPPDSGRD